MSLTIKSEQPGLAGRLLAIGSDTAPRLREPFRSADHGDLLYDERGLPAVVIVISHTDITPALPSAPGRYSRQD